MIEEEVKGRKSCCISCIHFAGLQRVEVAFDSVLIRGSAVMGRLGVGWASATTFNRDVTIDKEGSC